LGAFCHKDKLTFLESVSKEDSFYIHHDPIQLKTILGLLGLGLKFEVIFGIGFLANFHNILELNSHNLSQEIFDYRFAKF
jgi:hypothetical protein